MFGPLSEFATKSMTDPTAAIAPLRTAAREKVNTTYAGLPQVVTERLAQRGYGSSGVLPRALTDIETSRAGSLAGVEANAAEMALAQQNRGATLAEQLLGMPFGEESSGTSQYSGTQTMPGNMLAGGLTGGLGTLLQLVGLQAGSGQSLSDLLSGVMLPKKKNSGQAGGDVNSEWMYGG